MFASMELEVFGVDFHASVAFLCATPCSLWVAFCPVEAAGTESRREWTASSSATLPADQFPRPRLQPEASRRKAPECNLRPSGGLLHLRGRAPAVVPQIGGAGP